MNKVFSSLLIALIGGISALAFNHFLQTNSQAETQRLINERIPVKFAGNTAALSGSAPDFIQAAEMSVPGVVLVKTLVSGNRNYDPFFDYFFGSPYRNSPSQPTASGSGVIISEDGYIVTNNHVIANAEKVEVVLNDKREYPATVIGRDPNTDLALLKVDAKGLPFIYYGNSDDVRVGEWALAVGNPFSLTSTVTAGIISAKGRNINILNEKFAIESFIQTDAAVNPGNSGGALVNSKGELIGINAAIASNTGSYSGYSFAIPVNIVRKVVADLLEYGDVQRAFIGVVLENLDAKLANKKGISNIQGVYVSGLNAGGAAEESGILPGDVILKVQENQVNNLPELQEQIGRYRPGDKVDITISRDGKEKVIPVTLKNKNGDTRLIRYSESVANELGAEFEQLSEKERSSLRLENGVKVSKIRDGKLRRIGVREGFIITHIGDKPVANLEDITNALKSERRGMLIEGMYPNGTRAYYGLGI